MVDRAAAFNAKRINFVITHYFVDTNGDSAPDSYCLRQEQDFPCEKFGAGAHLTSRSQRHATCPARCPSAAHPICRIQPVPIHTLMAQKFQIDMDTIVMFGCLLGAGTLNAYMDGLKSCFQRVADYKLDIFITPHVNDGAENSKVWRNAVRLDPLKVAGEWSYSGGRLGCSMLGHIEWSAVHAGSAEQCYWHHSCLVCSLHCIAPRISSACCRHSHGAWLALLLHAAAQSPRTLPMQPHCSLT
jgi:hypothetical protein